MAGIGAAILVLEVTVWAALMGPQDRVCLFSAPLGVTLAIPPNCGLLCETEIVSTLFKFLWGFCH